MNETIIAALITVGASIILSIIASRRQGRNAAIEEAVELTNRFTNLEHRVEHLEKSMELLQESNKQLGDALALIGKSITSLDTHVQTMQEDIKEIKRYYATKDRVDQLTDLVKEFLHK